MTKPLHICILYSTIIILGDKIRSYNLITRSLYKIIHIWIFLFSNFQKTLRIFSDKTTSKNFINALTFLEPIF